MKPVFALLLPLLVAESDVQLKPGLWELVYAPTAIALDGRKLDDVQLERARTEQVCLAAAEVAEPARVFAREMLLECQITDTVLRGGAALVRAACPNPEEGNEGALELRGRFGAASYQLDYTNRSEDFEGVLTFSGTVSGRRLGSCPD